MRRLRALALFAALSAVLPATGAFAAGGALTTAKECGACHMPYQPILMPARSWTALLSHLSSHFGEDASLPDATRKTILTYLTAHAADSPYGSRGVMYGLTAADTPQRITDMPFWRRIHRRLLRPGVGTGPGIRTAANCLRCHNGSGGGDD